MPSPPKFSFEKPADLSSLWELIKALRGEDGCPWDKKQTPETLKKYLLEETYEVLSALSEGNLEELREEFGDLLFILLFIIYLFEERGDFTLRDVVYLNFQKMIRRHPHVFGDAVAKSAEEVLAQWQRIKKEEGKEDSVLGNIPKILPALQRAFRIGERASRVGFDWEKAEDILVKLREETAELEREIKEGKDKEKLELEIGDLLFTVANLSRKLGINPEEALHKTLAKFERRFKEMERLIKERGLKIEDLTLEELDKFWEEVKALEKDR